MHAALRSDVAEAARRLAAEGLVSGTSGNVSARHGDAIVISPSGGVLAELTAEAVVVVDRYGAPVEGDTPPSSELGLHLALYRRDEVGAVVHTHAPMATALSTVLDELPVVHYEMLALGGPVRVAPYHAFGTDELAEAAARAIDGRRAALLSNHGTVTVAADLAGALDATRLLEWAATLYWRAAQIGAPRVLDEVALRAAASAFAAYGRRG